LHQVRVDFEFKGDTSVPVAIVAPEERISPAATEAENGLSLGNPVLPFSKFGTMFSIAQMHAMEFERVVEILEARDLDLLAA
jgi:hypothetical protein